MYDFLSRHIGHVVHVRLDAGDEREVMVEGTLDEVFFEYPEAILVGVAGGQVLVPMHRVMTIGVRVDNNRTT